MTFGQLRIIFGTMSFAFFGVFYLPGGGSLPTLPWGDPPTSILASKCERLWRDEARNDPALECYLTSQPDRLCRPSEKDHLIWMVSRYQRARSLFEGKLWRFVAAVPKGMVLPGPGDKTEGVEKKFSRITSEEAGKLKADPLFVEAIKMPTRTDAQLTELLRRLAEKGYVSKGDFGWMSPAWVSEAFDDTLKVNAACVAPDA